jgi:hypothetical protein
MNEEIILKKVLSMRIKEKHVRWIRDGNNRSGVTQKEGKTGDETEDRELWENKRQIKGIFYQMADMEVSMLEEEEY